LTAGRSQAFEQGRADNANGLGLKRGFLAVRIFGPIDPGQIAKERRIGRVRDFFRVGNNRAKTGPQEGAEHARGQSGEAGHAEIHQAFGGIGRAGRGERHGLNTDGARRAGFDPSLGLFGFDVVDDAGGAIQLALLAFEQSDQIAQFLHVDFYILERLTEAKRWFGEIPGQTSEIWRFFIDAEALKSVLDADPIFQPLLASADEKKS
jgi:hypothetical protein